MYSLGNLLSGCSLYWHCVVRGTGLPQTKLGTYLENRVNQFLKRKDAGAGEVTIRVLSSSEKMVEVRPGMKAKFCTPSMSLKLLSYLLLILCFY